MSTLFPVAFKHKKNQVIEPCEKILCQSDNEDLMKAPNKSVLGMLKSQIFNFSVR